MNTDKITHKIVTFLLSCCLSTQAFAVQSPAQPKKTDLDLTTYKLYDAYQWSLLYYYAHTVNGALVGTFVGNYKNWPEHIQSIELAYTLHEDNFLRKLVNPLVGVVQIATNGTIRHGSNQHTIYEFDPYIVFRWANWPWNHYIVTSFAFAEGISYVSSVPAIEKRNNQNTKRILNYLMFEATFAMPKHPRFQFVLRVHHRSGAYGLYRAGNSGSNDVGAGIRYLF